jgi:hypothetical protein
MTTVNHRVGSCEVCGAPVQTRLTRHVICLECLVQVVSIARSNPAARLERAELAEWTQRSGFRPAHVLQDPDTLIEFLHWCERRSPDRCTQAHLDELCGPVDSSNPRALRRSRGQRPAASAPAVVEGSSSGGLGAAHRRNAIPLRLAFRWTAAGVRRNASAAAAIAVRSLARRFSLRRSAVVHR